MKNIYIVLALIDMTVGEKNIYSVLFDKLSPQNEASIILTLNEGAMTNPLKISSTNQISVTSVIYICFLLLVVTLIPTTCLSVFSYKPNNQHFSYLKRKRCIK